MHQFYDSAFKDLRICTWSNEWGEWSDCHFTKTEMSCGSGSQYQIREKCLCNGTHVLNQTLCGTSHIRIKYCFRSCKSM